jgi:two-component system cell cycle sensor histidine kinase/response regulator CckA
MSTSSNPMPDAPTILVVDDDLSVLTVVRCMLETSDYNVLLAPSAEVALRLVERDYLTIDLMLVDVVMPGLSGPELAERILEIRPHLRVLFMSGYTDAEVVRVKIVDRKLELLPKPFTSDGLRDVIDRALNTSMHLSAAAGVNGPSLSRSPR